MRLQRQARTLAIGCSWCVLAATTIGCGDEKRATLSGNQAPARAHITLPSRLGEDRPGAWYLSVRTPRDGSVCVRVRLHGTPEAEYELCNPVKKATIVGYHLRCATREALQFILAPPRFRAVRVLGDGPPRTARRYALAPSIDYKGSLFVASSTIRSHLRQLVTVDAHGVQRERVVPRTIPLRCSDSSDYVSG